MAISIYNANYYVVFRKWEIPKLKGKFPLKSTMQFMSTAYPQN